MSVTAICPTCNEENPGSLLRCSNCQTSLVGVPRAIKPLSESESAHHQTDEVQKLASEPKVDKKVEPAIAIPIQKKSNKNLWIIAGTICSMLCICSILCVAIILVSGSKVSAEKAPVESVLDSYMRHMANKDAASAYALFSPRAQRQFPISKIQALFEGNNFLLFEGYQSLSLSSLNVGAAANINPNFPQGTVANVTGVLNFEGGIHGSFNGTLEKVDGKWMIDGMNVTVPPTKIK
jgi:hypothetical protein